MNEESLQDGLQTVQPETTQPETVQPEVKGWAQSLTIIGGAGVTLTAAEIGELLVWGVGLAGLTVPLGIAVTAVRLVGIALVAVGRYRATKRISLWPFVRNDKSSA